MDWCWSWNFNTLATWCEELTHWKRPWCGESWRKGGEGDNRRWDSWMASPTRWTWVWVNSRSWWWTGRPGMLQSMGLQRVGHYWETELTDDKNKVVIYYINSVSQEFQSGLALWFWLIISHENCRQVFFRVAAVFWCWRIHFQDGLLTCNSGALCWWETSVPFPPAPLNRAAWVSYGSWLAPGQTI